MRGHRHHHGHGHDELHAQMHARLHRRRRGPFGLWTPLGFYVRHRLQRRLFLWFGLNILLTGIVVFFVTRAVSEGGNAEWRKMFEGGRHFLGVQFAQVWTDAEKRDALARQLAKDVGVEVVLRDKDGQLLSQTGECRGGEMEVPVVPPWLAQSHGSYKLGQLGTATICNSRPPAQPARFIVPLAVALAMLWAASGRLARRLARPLTDLARVAEEIGNGNLSARVELHPRDEGEVRVVAGAVNEMAARIEKQLKDQRELLAAVSHELRTPLQRIRLITELAREGVMDAKTLDSLDQEVIEIDALVGDLLASSRLDFGQLTLKALSAKDVALRALERANLGAELLDAPEDATIEADATLVGRALANLLENARRHGGGAKALLVRVVPDRISFEVDDAGPGFAAGEADHAFDPFFRKPRTTEGEAVGLGLGLALVKRVAEAHQGRAWAMNRAGGGARVGFELPLKPIGETNRA